MKLFLPIFHQLPIETGFGLRNPLHTRGLTKEPQVQVSLWKGFNLLAEKKISFQGKDGIQCYLQDLFTDTELKNAGIASVEFAVKDLSPSDKANLLGQSFEGQSFYRDATSKLGATILYDMIPDKKPGHIYSPILHSAHSASVSDIHDTYAVLLNFRPPYLETTEVQPMKIQTRGSNGKVLSESQTEIGFNESLILSFKKEFKPFGGFESGCSLTFKGGKSQFAIFTLFRNEKTGALGIEHSLAPHYYVSAVANPVARKKFYENAFKGFRSTP